MSNEYTKGLVSEIERARLRKGISYFDSVSVEALGDVSGGTVLDVGAGPNPFLGKWVNENAGCYVGLEPNPKFAEDLERSGLVALRCPIEQLVPEAQFDIVHTRLVLMHMPWVLPDVIKNILGCAARRAVFVELDWSVFDSSAPLIRRFRDLTIAAFCITKDFMIGRHLRYDVLDVADPEWDVRMEWSVRRPGRYYDELMPIVMMTANLVKQLKFPDSVIAEFENIAQRLKTAVEQGEAAPFVPPAVTVVQARRW